MQLRGWEGREGKGREGRRMERGGGRGRELLKSGVRYE